jgi:hypothetical protein
MRPELVVREEGLSTSHTSPLFQESPSPSSLFEPFVEEGGASEAQEKYVRLASMSALPFFSLPEFRLREPKLIVMSGGSLVTVKTGRVGPGGGGGDRGVVTGFSSASRRRLMRIIASLERSERPIFVTMTYPDIFSNDLGKWKRDIDVFGKRLAREYPQAGFLWRIEFKERKTGASRGLIAPHFHLLVYGGSYRDLLGWVPEAWWAVVGSGNVDHLRAGTRVERIYSWGGIMRYVGKYIAKEEDYPPGWQGRVWGVIGRARLPWAVEVVIGLTEEESTKLVRLGRKMIGAKGRTFAYGLTWIVNAERVLDYLEWLVAFAQD